MTVQYELHSSLIGGRGAAVPSSAYMPAWLRGREMGLLHSAVVAWSSTYDKLAFIQTSRLYLPTSFSVFAPSSPPSVHWFSFDMTT